MDLKTVLAVTGCMIMGIGLLCGLFKSRNVVVWTMSLVVLGLAVLYCGIALDELS